MNAEIERVLAAALYLPADERAAYVEHVTDDILVREEVLSLLAHDVAGESLFEDALAGAASSLRFEEELPPGARLGPFAVERAIGRGGMGVVYLATRVDGAFEQRVAIKLIAASGHSATLRNRFLQERQILARLNHPNIARLLDGGNAPSGVPYFVLEYVAGEDIVRYCARAGLDLRSRLALFLPVCDALQYAHENMVVHRDLKPANILVDSAGAPKLLDFGIARLLDGPVAAGLQTNTRALTPAYASPEQIRGDPITTATDLYSAGAVLYCMLTGRPPHDVRELAPLSAARRISEQPVPPAGGVCAEIEAILAKALHTDPSRRYRSAHELSSDVRRFLAGRAVLAAGDSLRYRATTFLRRNRLPVFAAAAVLVAVVSGSAVALREAHLAQRRFEDVRRLSTRFLFEFEEAIHDVSGATRGRELLVTTARDYLDRLAGESRGDPVLTADLAECYRKLGDVEGSLVEGNTGHTQASLNSYRKALALRDSIGADRSVASGPRITYLNLLTDLAALERQAGDASRALALSRRSVALGEKWADGSRDPDLLTAAAIANAGLVGSQSAAGDFAGALASANRSLALKQRASVVDPNNPVRRRALATGHWAVAAVHKAAGNSGAAIDEFSAAVVLLRECALGRPADVTIRRELLAASWQLAASTKDLLRKQKKNVAAALPLLAKVFADARLLLAEDPANALVESDLAGIALIYGATLQQCGQPAPALEVLGPAIDRQQTRLRAAPEIVAPPTTSRSSICGPRTAVGTCEDRPQP